MGLTAPYRTTRGPAAGGSAAGPRFHHAGGIMNRQQKRSSRLDLQLEAIADTLAMAQQEPSPEHRADLLLLVERAFAVYHQEHRAALAARPHFRLLQGGASTVVLVCPVGEAGPMALSGGPRPAAHAYRTRLA